MNALGLKSAAVPSPHPWNFAGLVGVCCVVFCFCFDFFTFFWIPPFSTDLTADRRDRPPPTGAQTFYSSKRAVVQINAFFSAAAFVICEI